jgi:hypothetical protein
VKYEKIMGLKLQHRPEVFCKDFPPEFLAMQSYIRGLKFDERPNYEFLRQQIYRCMKDNNGVFDYNYDWEGTKETVKKLTAY